MLTIVAPNDEWLRDCALPSLDDMHNTGADIFTFWQRFPDVEPHYSIYHEWDNVAVVNTKDFERWWQEVGTKTRAMIRKAEKLGLVTRWVDPSPGLFAGITEIYNELPVRQGRPYPHFGATVSQVERDFGQWPSFQTFFVGAYEGVRLLGFTHVIKTSKYALLNSIQGYEQTFHKATMNGLIAKTIEICSNQDITHLVYGKMQWGGLGAFKRHNGFLKVNVPRYYVPLTLKGRIALGLKLHHRAWRGWIPDTVKIPMHRLRSNLRK